MVLFKNFNNVIGRALCKHVKNILECLLPGAFFGQGKFLAFKNCLQIHTCFI